MIINYIKKVIQIKIVYFGMKNAGKKTCLEVLMKHFGKENDLKSIETSRINRSMVFNFGTLNITGNEWNLKILLLSANAQDFYASTRPATIEMVDGIVFVMDSQIKFLKENLQSWKELFLYFGERIYELPLIICLNKQDLSDLVDIPLIKKELNLVNYQKYKITKMISSKNEGVVNGFKMLLSMLFPTIFNKNDNNDKENM